MKKISVIAVAAILSSALIGCSDNDSKLKGQFIQGCMGNSTKDVCTCTYETLEEDYSPEQLFDMMTKMEHFETLSAAIQKAQRKCLL